MRQLEFLLKDLVAKKNVSKEHVAKVNRAFDTIHQGGVPDELRGADKPLIVSIRDCMDRLLQATYLPTCK